MSGKLCSISVICAFLAIVSFGGDVAARDSAEDMSLMDAIKEFSANSPSGRERAAEVIRSRARSGDALAQFYFGIGLLTGELSRETGDDGIAWLERSASQGNGSAQLELGKLLAAGKLVTKDEPSALRLLESAASQGSVEAKFFMAKFLDGASEPFRDRARAARLLQEAASSGYADAQYALAMKYLSGDSVPRDYDLGELLLVSAAKAKHKKAILAWGGMYDDGLGRRKDLCVAYALYNYVGASGDALAASLRNRLENRMGIDALECGQSLTRRIMLDDGPVKVVEAHLQSGRR